MTDRELLQQVARQRSEPAFTEIVRRHLDLVYSAALRQLGNGDAARDVAQQVFLLLAREAPGLKRDVILTGWLYRATRNLCLETIRNDRRRREREQAAAEVLMNPDTDPPWDQIAPALEPAMDELTESERQAILLRFFQNKSLRDVGTELGIGEDAAQKRVSRALERLRDIFNSRGVTLTVAALATAISSGAVQSAPAGMLALVSAAALGAGLATMATQSSIATVSAFSVKTAAIAVVAAGLSGGATYRTKQHEIDVLQHQQSEATETHARLNADHLAALATIRLRDERINQLQRDAADIHRLRGEVDDLKRQHALLIETAAEADRLRDQVGKLRRQLISLYAQHRIANIGNAGVENGDHSDGDVFDIWGAQISMRLLRLRYHAMGLEYSEREAGDDFMRQIMSILREDRPASGKMSWEASNTSVQLFPDGYLIMAAKRNKLWAAKAEIDALRIADQ